MELKINSLLGKFRSKNKTQVRTDMDKKWAERILEYDSWVKVFLRKHSGFIVIYG